MSGGFGSNISSLRAQRRLASSVSQLGAHLTRLSSGLRINRASDDAAGLAIADGLRKDSRLFATAARNTNDAISALNIIDGALTNQKGILDRLKELATQSANGVYTETQRRALNNEYRALVKEMGRLGDTTSFNGLQLLRGARGGLDNLLLQVGVTGADSSRIAVQTADTGTISGFVRIRTTDDPATLFTHISGGLGFSSFDELRDFYGEGLLSTTAVISGQQRDVYVGLIEGDSLEIFLSIYVENSDGSFSMGAPGEFITPSYDPSTGRLENFSAEDMIFGDFGFGSIHLDFSGLAAFTDYYEDQTGSRPSTTSMEFTGVEDVIRARAALEAASARADELSQLVSRFGALQSRLGSTLGVLSASRLNSSAAESRIRDADIAEEAAGMIRSQILQQTGAQVLSLAKQQPEMLLSLLF